MDKKIKISDNSIQYRQLKGKPLFKKGTSVNSGGKSNPIR